ncbi:MAG: hypothetical protein IPJ52_09895 [Rhodocyclaceae bacterium]|nr:hypothetical protein [Rhodocyclaceae bacterium]
MTSRFASTRTARHDEPWLRVFLPFAVGYYLSYLLLRNVNAVIAPELMRELSLSWRPRPADLGLPARLCRFPAAAGPAARPPGSVASGPACWSSRALGCAVFAIGDSLPQLAIGRGLIGLGSVPA